MENIEKIFYEDSRDKKRIGSNVSKRALRRGGIRGGIKTTYDFLSASEKRKLNGEVKVYNMYDKYKDINNCDISELRKLPKGEERINIFKFIKENHNIVDIMEKWNSTKGNVSNIFSRETGNLKNKFSFNDIKALGVYAIENDNILNYDAYRNKRDNDKAMIIKRYIEKYPVMCVAMMMNTSKSTIANEVKKRIDKYTLNVSGAFNLIKTIRNKYDSEKIDEILIKNSIDIERYNNGATGERSGPKYIKKSEKAIKSKTQEILEVQLPLEEGIIKVDHETNNDNLAERYDALLQEIKELKNNIDKLKEKVVKEEVVQDGISFNLKGCYSKEEVEKRLVSTSYILSDEHKYNIDLKITEVKEIEIK